ncbi:hypothetical protein VIGAN_UM102600 [Vigna angularis var. angularis]|uniref:Uncharacterized protein n=1 Tax=Vigna angularis var. angularis TaxID=157739 RepID=A0A0S3RIW3_PHAAN|nr:hypothetical protein VIGAN_02342500 [Vigna angularis var. angularis]BAU03421.1 hypothetical protein VIGAN_UM102600 [Vigna angularis var. angularis]
MSNTSMIMLIDCLKQSDNDMTSFIAKSQSIVEELKMFLVVHSLVEIKEMLDKFYMVMILYAMNLDFYHISDQILTCQEVSSMENLTRLDRVPSLLYG